MDKRELLRGIPKIDEVLKDQRLVFLMEKIPRAIIVETVREVMDQMRQDILHDQVQEIQSSGDLMQTICDRVMMKNKRSLHHTINATGTVLHTNLGRANLSKNAIEQVLDVCGQYSNLEYDVKAGHRGSRHDHVEQIICKITGAEAAMVVNNNAAATMLCLSSMGKGKEVIVSRGELVEIGGSFRVPDIMAQSGAKLVEVGTTNKTKLSDYQQAITEETAALMKVHTSNYRILGFTQEVTLEELVPLGRETGLPVIYDMGCGLIANLSEVNMDEPTVMHALGTGIDVILFSGDKLLGGPQGGIIVGKKQWIDQMKKHPLARVLRVDKMTLAAMEATFREYLDMDQAKENIPVLRMITMSIETLEHKARDLKELLNEKAPELSYSIVGVKDQIGGGSAPLIRLPGIGIMVQGSESAEWMERQLRKAKVPVIARIAEDHVILDVRTISENEYELVAIAVAGMVKR